MSRQRPRRSVAIVTRAGRTDLTRLRSRAPRADGRADRVDRSTAPIPAADLAALGFLGEILAGDGEWTLGEVRRLIALRHDAAGGPRDGTEPGSRCSGG